MPSILDQLLGNGQQAAPNTAQQILSARFDPSQVQMPNYQPSGDDIAQSIFRNTTGFNANAGYNPQSPQQVYGQNQSAVIAPLNEMLKAQGQNLGNQIQAQTALPMAQSDMALKNAQADYYGNAQQRDIAEKAFQYANDPQMAQARGMAQYMQSLSGMGGQQQPPPQQGGQPIDASQIPQVNASGLQPPAGIQLSGSDPNAAPTPQSGTQPAQGGGFNPMGAMLAKQLGLTDMQIGPNGQPMPIPGSMKVENGSVISFDANGKPQSNIPVNPRAQGLFEQKLQDINTNLDKLQAIGGTVDEKAGFMGNKMTQLAASSTGQDYLQGSEAQTLRDNISADVKQALPLYMQAFGITPGMERAQAAQQMLQEAIGGSLGKSVQHTKSNLINLSKTAGNGTLARALSRVNVMGPNGEQGTIDLSEVQAATANGWKVSQ